VMTGPDGGVLPTPYVPGAVPDAPEPAANADASGACGCVVVPRTTGTLEVTSVTAILFLLARVRRRKRG
jgi:hypothetical protein